MNNPWLWIAGLALLAVIVAAFLAARRKQGSGRGDETYRSGKGMRGVGKADPTPAITPANLGMPVSPAAESLREAKEDSLLGEQEQGEEDKRR